MNARIKDALIYALSYLEDLYPYEDVEQLCLNGACIYLVEAIHHFVPETMIAVHKSIDHVGIYDLESEEIYDATFVPLDKNDYDIMTFEEYYKTQREIGNPDIINTAMLIEGIEKYKKRNQDFHHTNGK